MENKEILKRLLKPVDPGNEGKWEEFLNTLDDNISWYPSAGLDFRDVLFLYNNGFNCTPLIPSVYIHTDEQLPYDIINKKVEVERGIEVIINNVVELTIIK